jgi:pimeloyl-ACP methyl ester carboxylesterase
VVHNRKTLAMYITLLLLVVAAPLFVVAWSFPRAPELVDVPDIQSLRLREGVVRFQDEGSGEFAMLFLHGFNGQLSDWNDTWDELSGMPRKVRMDIPGFGGSEFDSRDYDLESQARRVFEFLDARGIRRVVIVAASMGGSLAAVLAAREPQRVIALELLAPSGHEGSLRYGGVRGLLMRPGPLKDAAAAISAWQIYRSLFPDNKARQGLTVTFSYGAWWDAILPEVKAPTVLLWSRGDYGVHFSAAPEVAQSIRGSRLLWLDEKTGHLIPLTRPQLVANVARRLMAGESPDDIAATPPRELLRAGEAFD